MKKQYLILFILSLVIKSMAQEPGTLKDSRDGKTYKTVKIGDQVWMAENLAYCSKSGCWMYINNSGDSLRYEYLYSWETAKNACPPGWHLPAKTETEALLNNAKNNGKAAYDSLIQGGNSGFSAIFAGFRNSYGNIDYVGKYAYFWSSSAHDDKHAWVLSIIKYNSYAFIGYDLKICGFSVRCLKDN